jgi:hypothetical protein
MLVSIFAGLSCFDAQISKGLAIEDNNFDGGARSGPIASLGLIKNTLQTPVLRNNRKVPGWLCKRPYILSNINLAGAHKINSIHDIVRPHFGLRIFAPPFGPPDLMGSASGINDSSLFGGTECPIEAC